MSTIKKIAVFCGASCGNKAEYTNAAKTFSESLLKHDLTLVYGGAQVGLMGVIANHLLDLGGQAIGVIPNLLVEKEIVHTHLTELHVVPSMHERKLLIMDLADAFVMLPGGVGSLDEFFEVMTLSQLGFHNKPFGILNISNYFSSLLTFLDHAADEGFLKKIYRERIIVNHDCNAMLEAILQYRLPPVMRWENTTVNEECSSL